MAIPNRISGSYAGRSTGVVSTAIESINNALPFLVDLSPDEIRELPKFGDKSVAFVKKTLELVKQNDSFLPRSFNVEEFQKDVLLYDDLYSIIQPLRMLLEKIQDTYLLAGSEAYAAALVVYASAKNARGDVAGLDELLDDFGKRFVNKSLKKNTDEPEAE